VSYENPPSADGRKALLAQAIMQEVVRGGRVETQSDYSAIVRYEKPVNHILHLILTLVSCGFWAVVWLILWVIAVVDKQTVSLYIDEYGNVLRQRIK